MLDGKRMDAMSDAVRWTLDFAAATDTGCKRANNEDSYGYDAARQLFVVCDGMGGMAAGEVASSTAVREVLAAFDLESQESLQAPAEEKLLRAITTANEHVYSCSIASHTLGGMGTTLVCACLDGNRIIIGNVGDSRAYFSRDGLCFQITSDHSLVSEQLREGLITPEMAAVSEMQSVITRAIGVESTVQPDMFVADVVAGDIVLLASDGLTRYVEAEEIGSLINLNMVGGHSLQQVCQALIDTAKQRGGADNITCLVLRVAAAEGLQ